MITDRKLYEKATAALDNKYAAVCYIFSLARKLMKTAGYSISDTEALSWAISGVKPEPVKVSSLDHFYVKLPVSDVLQLVDDKEVCNAVIDSLRASIHAYFAECTTLYNVEEIPEYSEDFISKFLLNNDLDDSWIQFCYNDIEDDRQGRVRILVRIIWNKYEY